MSDASAIHPLAAELNRVLEPTAIGRSLSGLGRRLYFPKGVVAQSAEAAEHADRFNATVGLAASGGEPMHLPAIADRLPGLTAEEAFAYAPTAGIPALRDRWAEELQAKEPFAEIGGVAAGRDWRALPRGSAWRPTCSWMPTIRCCCRTWSGAIID